MRISDWSSDVCSSDLSRDGRLAAILHDGYQETSTYEEFSEALLDASRFLHSCPNVYTRHRIARMNVHTPTYMRSPGEVSGNFALECAMDELRSEEHTSELQSLMRISYAVFCLQ